MARTTVYVPAARLKMAAQGKEGKCTVYSMGGIVSTVCTEKLTLKSTAKLMERPTDDTTFLLELLENCQRHGVRPPSSWASLYRRMFGEPSPPRALTRILQPLSGPWIWAKTGVFKPAAMWDLNRAYETSMLRGFPRRNDIRECGRRGWRLAVADVTSPGGILPPPFMGKGEARVLITPDELESFGLKIKKIRYAITWRDECASSIGRNLDEIERKFGPVVRKNVGQRMWGTWASVGVVVGRIIDSDGTELRKWRNHNNAYDPLRAHLTQSRVKIEVAEAAKHMSAIARIYVDSIVAQQTPDLFLDKSRWRDVWNKPRGIRISYPGGYSDPDTGEILRGT